MSKKTDPFQGPSMFDLRGKQSVRATFKLSQKAIDAIGLVAVHMGIKQKSLFDHIIEDMAALDELAQNIRIQQFKKIQRRQKTYVLSRRTIEVLTQISDTHGMPRDALVEYSVQKLEALIQTEKMRHGERKRHFTALMTHFEQGELLYRKAVKALGADDPLCRRLEKAVLAARKAALDTSDFMEKSKVLEDF